MENELGSDQLTVRVADALTGKVVETSTMATRVAAQLTSIAVEYAFSVVGAIAILVIGLTFAGWLSRVTRRQLMRFDHVDLTLAAFLANIVKYIVWVLVFVVVLGQFGVGTTSIITVLGAAGLAIGLALQGTLSNIAAGIMLLVLRPFRVGEYIEAGNVKGVAQEIGLFTTELKLPNGLFVMAPNSQIWNQPIVNFSRNPQRRFEFVVGIGYGDDMQAARNSLLEIANADERVLADPAPVTFINSLDDSSVGVGLWCWVAAPDYLATARDLTERAKATFDDVGITIPYPQREVTQYVVDARQKAKKTASAKAAAAD
ncbi:mechanosensitive ion channel [Rhizobiaceae bacterium]|nr:mechanosensitive ion channel [Rhizobiaceae bacterium]